MKVKCLSIITLLFLILNVASTQNMLHWGVRFGFDVPTNKKDFSNSLKYEQTLNYNVGFQLRVGNRLFGQTAVDYYINKCKFIWQDTAISKESMELSYLAIPVEAGFHIFQINKFSLRAMAGLQYRALVRLTKNDIGIEKKHFQQHNLDAIASLGVDVYSFTVDIGYRKSFFPVMPASSHYRDMFTLSLGLIF